MGRAACPKLAFVGLDACDPTHGRATTRDRKQATRTPGPKRAQPGPKAAPSPDPKCIQPAPNPDPKSTQTHTSTSPTNRQNHHQQALMETMD